MKELFKEIFDVLVLIGLLVDVGLWFGLGLFLGMKAAS